MTGIRLQTIWIVGGVILIVFSLGGAFDDWLERLTDHRQLTVHHPTLETVVDATPGGVYRIINSATGATVYYTFELKYFQITDIPGELILVTSPRTLWHPDSCVVRLEVVK